MSLCDRFENQAGNQRWSCCNNEQPFENEDAFIDGVRPVQTMFRMTKFSTFKFREFFSTYPRDETRLKVSLTFNKVRTDTVHQ